MIYQPLPVYDLRVLIAEGVVDAAIAAIEDFVAEDNKPWTYYLGVGVGGMIGATGIKEAVATAYVICDQLDVTLWHSPQGSLVRCYVDGLLQATIDTYSGTPGAVIHTINLANNIKHRIDMINGDPSPSQSTGISWMGIGDIQAYNGYVQPKGGNMAVDILSYGIRDGDGQHASMPVFLPSGLTIAQMQTFATAQAALLNAIIDGVIDSISATFSLTIPGGLNASAANGVEKQKGGLFDFQASGTKYTFGLYVPTMKPTLFDGDSVLTSDTDVAAFIASMVTGASPALPSDRYGNDLTALKKADKRFRK